MNPKNAFHSGKSGLFCIRHWLLHSQALPSVRLELFVTHATLVAPTCLAGTLSGGGSACARTHAHSSFGIRHFPRQRATGNGQRILRCASRNASFQSVFIYVHLWLKSDFRFLFFKDQPPPYHTQTRNLKPMVGLTHFSPFMNLCEKSTLSPNKIKPFLLNGKIGFFAAPQKLFL